MSKCKSCLDPVPDHVPYCSTACWRADGNDDYDYEQDPDEEAA